MPAAATVVARLPVPGRPRRAPRALTLGAALSLALVGCVAAPAPAPDPDALGARWPAMTAHLDAARSVDVTARWAEPAATVSLAGSLEADGAYRGTTTGPEGTTQAVHAGQVTYLRGDGAEAALAEVDPGRWLALPGAARDLVSPAELIEKVRAELPDELAPRDAALGGHEVTVDGERLERFTGVLLDDAGPVDLYLDAQGRLARITRAGGGTATGPPGDGALLPRVESVDFDDWDAVPPVRAPAPEDVWDRPGL